MRFICLFLTTLLAVIPASATPGKADALARHDARVLSARAPMVSAVSSRTGSRTRSGIPASFGRGASEPGFRGMVKLAMRFDDGDGRVMTEHCGGTVIGSRWIVTAAHCVSPPDGSRWDRIDIMAGDRNLDGNGIIRRRSFQAIIHAGFDYATLANDIALLRLKEPLPRSVVPSRLDDQSKPSIGPGHIARAAGWPITGARAGRRTLQTTDVAVSTKSLPGYITVASPTGQIEGVCQGESGGPLMSFADGTAQLAGVLSGIEPGTKNAAGEPCMLGGYAMYFTPIASYRAWIDRVRTVCSFNPKLCSQVGTVQVTNRFFDRKDKILAGVRQVY